MGAQRDEYTKCQVNWLQVIVEPEPGNSAPYNNNGGAASPNPNTNNNNNNNNNNGYVDEGLDLGDFGRDSVNGGYADNNKMTTSLLMLRLPTLLLITQLLTTQLLLIAMLLLWLLRLPRRLILGLSTEKAPNNLYPKFLSYLLN